MIYITMTANNWAAIQACGFRQDKVYHEVAHFPRIRFDGKNAWGSDVKSGDIVTIDVFLNALITGKLPEKRHVAKIGDTIIVRGGERLLSCATGLDDIRICMLICSDGNRFSSSAKMDKQGLGVTTEQMNIITNNNKWTIKE